MGSLIIARCYFAFAIFSLVLWSTGCSPQRQSAAAPSGAPAAGLQLPSLAELARQASSTVSYPSQLGADFSVDFSAHAALSDGTKLELTPVGTDGTLETAAWATFDFTVPSGATPSLVCSAWSTPPEELWYGIADYNSQSFVWLPGTAGVECDFDPIIELLSPLGHCYVIVLVTGSTSAVMDSIRVDGDFALSADPVTGAAPLEVTFTFSHPLLGSGTCEFDFDNDGTADATDPDGQVTHIYTEPAGLNQQYTATATFSDGTTLDVSSTAVLVTEGNDNPVARIDYVAYSEFTERRDWAAPGTDLYFSFDNSFDPDGYIDHYNVDWDNDGVFESTYLKDTEISYGWDTPGPKTAVLKVVDNKGATATDTVVVFYIGPPYDEAEPNNTYVTAQPLVETSFHHFSGAVTSGANAEDWYRFNLESPQFIRVQLHMEGYPGSSYPELELYAGDGTTLLDAPGIGQEIRYECDAGMYYIQCVDLDGGNHDYDLAMCTADELPTADLTCDVTSGEAPFIVRCEAYPLTPEGFDIGCKDVCWDFYDNGTCENGYPDNPVADQRAFDFVVWQTGSLQLAVELVNQLDQQSNSFVEIISNDVVTDIEPNDNPAAAGALTLWSNFQQPDWFDLADALGAVGPQSEGGSTEDWYKFTLPDKGDLTLFADNEVMGRMTVELYDSDGTTLLETMVPYQGQNARIHHYFAAGGTFYIRVVASDSEPGYESGGGYRVGGYFKRESGSG